VTLAFTTVMFAVVAPTTLGCAVESSDGLTTGMRSQLTERVPPYTPGTGFVVDKSLQPPNLIPLALFAFPTSKNINGINLAKCVHQNVWFVLNEACVIFNQKRCKVIIN